jgi:hypothetical protein
MKMKRCNRTIQDREIKSIEWLIEELGKIRASTNVDIHIGLDGDDIFGYSLKFHWNRPMTEEEEAEYARDKKRAEDAHKEYRRQEYEKLKAEFENKE